MLQELPRCGAELKGYRTVPEAAKAGEVTSARRSALLVRQTLDIQPAVVNPLLDLLGAYVVSSRIRLGTEWINVVSVHAAPYEWKRPLPAGYQLESRSCEKHLWHSDIAAAGLVEMAETGPTLALGDFNECFGWDDPRHQGHHCGEEFFSRLGTERLIDCTTKSWGQERQTGPQRGYQVDRVLADLHTARRMQVSVDPLEFDGLSDHAAIWFGLAG